MRDEGPGFELGAVPTERRGVRDSIVGRMAAVGGTRGRRVAPRRGHRGRAADRGDVGMRIVVVDDHHLFRAGRARRARRAPRGRGRGGDARRGAGGDRGDVARRRPARRAPARRRRRRGAGGAAGRDGPKVLALSVSDAAEDVVPMIRAGALGYVTKTIDTAELLAAIETVAAGEACFSPRLAAFVLQAFSAPAPAAVRAGGADAARARGAAPPRPRLLLQADRAAARDQRPHGRVPRRRRPAQAPAHLAPRGLALGGDPRARRLGRRRMKSSRRRVSLHGLRHAWRLRRDPLRRRLQAVRRRPHEVQHRHEPDRRDVPPPRRQPRATSRHVRSSRPRSPSAELTEPDDVGVFEIHLEADDKEQALRASGTPSRPPAPTTTSSSSSTPTSRSTGTASPGAPRRSFVEIPGAFDSAIADEDKPDAE